MNKSCSICVGIKLCVYSPINKRGKTRQVLWYKSIRIYAMYLYYYFYYYYYPWDNFQRTICCLFTRIRIYFPNSLAQWIILLPPGCCLQWYGGQCVYCSVVRLCYYILYVRAIQIGRTRPWVVAINQHLTIESGLLRERYGQRNAGDLIFSL